MPPGTTFLINNLGPIVAAAGALGTACFGIVEGLKWTTLGVAGFGQVRKYLGADLWAVLKVAYGVDLDQLLRAQYRQDSQTQAAIAKTLRQGVRIGLTPGNAEAAAQYLGTVDKNALKTAVENAAKASQGVQLSDDDRGIIGRFELAIDARIDSALSRAQDVYLGAVRGTASIFAIGIACVVAMVLDPSGSQLLGGVVVGLVAVPIAPIANDVVGAIQAATKALRSR